jgi:cellulose synthase/poly-beta-1,6-N-acetylglucosamine synthase-like glycosyltransferase
VVESKSITTLSAVRAQLGDPRFRLVPVPEGGPATKPKAIDFALPLARGEYVVVYDAEDVPDPDQLRRAASRFAAQPRLACLQAELVPENAGENLLTALFAGEYAGLFGRLLPALAHWRLPLPLGGTSNHFRIEVLREIGGWDARNVTEDADLGVRLARRGYRVEMLRSRTLEEAPLHLWPWMKQRTRWMKGWMQTYMAHSRRPMRLLRDLGWRGFWGFHVLVGGMLFGSVLHTLFAATLLFRIAAGGVASLLPADAWDWCSDAILIGGYGGAVALTIAGLWRQRAGWRLMACQLLLPLYWILHSFAAARAAWQLLREPSRWEKTEHGVTRVTRGQQVRGRVAALRPRTG